MPPTPRVVVELLVRASVLGGVVALLASAYVFVEHELLTTLWFELPARAGFGSAPWWWVIGLLVVGAMLTALALRLPGRGGHSPLDGFGFDIGPSQIGSVLAAALASLAFGAVLGPEAPLLALGTACGFVAARVGRRSPASSSEQKLLMLAGGIASFGAVLGNPLVSAFFLVEAALLNGIPIRRPIVLGVPAVALAFGYTIQVGLEDRSGLGETQLGVPGLSAYPEVLLEDLLLVVPMAATTALVTLGALGLARRLHAKIGPSSTGAMLGAAVLIGVIAASARAIADVPLEFILFSGQSGMAGMVGTTSVVVVVLAILGKWVAFTLCLGTGFRGGPVFPAIFLAVSIAVLPSAIGGSTLSAGLVAGCTAAATVAVTKLPFVSALLATLLCAPAGLAVTSVALFGAVVAMLTVLLVQRARAPEPQQPEP